MTCFLLTITIYFESREACRGEILTRTQINAPLEIKTHLGGIDDGVIFILKILWAPAERAVFSSRQKGRSLSTTRGLSVHMPAAG